MRTTLFLIVVALLVAGGALALWLRSGPDASQFAYLREPRLARLSDQHVLIVEAAGDPNVGGVSTRVVGEHEEEYVKGPGMLFAGDPEQYLTIIRLRVEKDEVSGASD